MNRHLRTFDQFNEERVYYVERLREEHNGFVTGEQDTTRFDEKYIRIIMLHCMYIKLWTRTFFMQIVLQNIVKLSLRKEGFQPQMTNQKTHLCHLFLLQLFQQ